MGKRAGSPNRADLAAAVAGADRVVVTPGLLEPRQEDLARPVFEVRGEGEASALMSEIDFVPPAHGLLWSEGFRCTCDGQYHLDFYRGAQLLASVGWHEAQSAGGTVLGGRMWNSPRNRDQLFRTGSQRGFQGLVERHRVVENASGTVFISDIEQERPNHGMDRSGD